MSMIIEARKIGVKFSSNYNINRTLRKSIFRYLSKERGSENRWFWAIREVSFSVERGEIVGIIGRNGSGKTTLLRIIGGIYTPDEGCIRLQGTISTLLSLGTGFQQDLTGIENIFLNGVIMGFHERDINQVLEDIICFSELENFIKAPVKTYSSGMLARLGFSIAVHLKRDIMLIDEILGVGDIQFRKKCSEKMKELMKDGRTIILVSHNMESIRSYTTKAIWIDKGALRAIGQSKDIVRQYLDDLKS